MPVSERHIDANSPGSTGKCLRVTWLQNRFTQRHCLLPPNLIIPEPSNWPAQMRPLLQVICEAHSRASELSHLQYLGNHPCLSLQLLGLTLLLFLSGPPSVLMGLMHMLRGTQKGRKSTAHLSLGHKSDNKKILNQGGIFSYWIKEPKPCSSSPIKNTGTKSSLKTQRSLMDLPSTCIRCKYLGSTTFKGKTYLPGS